MTKKKKMMEQLKLEYLRLLPEEVHRQSLPGRPSSAGEDSPGGDEEDLLEDDSEGHCELCAVFGSQIPRLVQA